MLLIEIEILFIRLIVFNTMRISAQSFNYYTFAELKRYLTIFHSIFILVFKSCTPFDVYYKCKIQTAGFW